MKPRKIIAGAVFALGVVLGTLVNRPPADAPGRAGAFTILAGDFHVHAFPGDGVLPVSQLAAEARRRRLDVIAITNHNSLLAARLPRRAPAPGDPIVISGQEVTAPGYHIAAVGIAWEIDWRGGATAVIDRIHAQQGVAIAAHPVRDFWAGFDDAALATLDGSEVAHPRGHEEPEKAADLTAFHQRARSRQPSLAAIGSSDFHFFPPLGVCRTYLFVRDLSESGVLEAIRAGRTVAIDGQGHAHGPAAFTAAAQREHAARTFDVSIVERAAVLLTWAGLLALALL